MPYSDPQKKLERMREWRKEKIAEGYGKALYARRKQRLENEQILRTAIEDALAKMHHGGGIVQQILERALLDAPPVTGKPIDYMEVSVQPGGHPPKE